MRLQHTINTPHIQIIFVNLRDTNTISMIKNVSDNMYALQVYIHLYSLTLVYKYTFE